MKLYNITLSSLNRQKGKKLFLLLALIIGTSTVVSLFTFVNSQKTKIANQFDQFGANIIVTPKSDNLTLSYGGVNVAGVTSNHETINLGDIDKIWNIHNKKNLRSVSPKILTSALIKGQTTKTILLVGVYFDEEKKIKNWWEFTGRLPENQNEVLLGHEVSQKLGINLQDKIYILDKKKFVSGVLKPTGSQDDGIIFADFNFVASSSGNTGKVSLVEVSALCSDCPIEEITADIRHVVPGADVKEIKQVMTQKLETVNEIEKFALAVTLVIILIGGILIFTSMMGAVTDRKKEIGVFRAIGFKKNHIVSIILLESVIISSLAGLLGVVIGLVVSYFFLPVLTGTETGIIKINSINLMMIFSTFSAVVLLGIVSSIYPAYSASQTDPVKNLSSL